MISPFRLPLLLALAATGCAVTSSVRPTGNGKSRWTASLGGPITKLKGAVIPAPVLTTSYVRGLSGSLDAGMALPLTPLLFGVVAPTAGLKAFLVEESGAVPECGVGLGALAVTSLRPNVDRTPLFLPWLDTTAAWRLGPGDLYLGTDLFVHLRDFDYQEDAPRTAWSPFTGYRAAFGADWLASIELKKFVANWRTDQVAADLYSISGDGLKTKHPQHGAVGVLIGLGAPL